MNGTDKSRSGAAITRDGRSGVGRLLALAGTALLSLLASQAFAVAVTDIEFSSRPGSKFEVRLEFDGAPPAELQAYTIEKPARIAIDFPDTTSSLESKRFSLPYGNATGVMVLESGDRTRLILNLVKLVPYETRVDGNNLYLTVGQETGTAQRLCSVGDADGCVFFSRFFQ